MLYKAKNLRAINFLIYNALYLLFRDTILDTILDTISDTILDIISDTILSISYLRAIYFLIYYIYYF